MPTSQTPWERRSGKRSRAQPSSAPLSCTLRSLGRAGNRAGGARVWPVARLEAESSLGARPLCQLSPGTADPSLSSRPSALLAGGPRLAGHRQGEGEGPAALPSPFPGTVSSRQHRSTASALSSRSGRGMSGRGCSFGLPRRMESAVNSPHGYMTSCVGPTTRKHAGSPALPPTSGFQAISPASSRAPLHARLPQ